GIIEFGAPVIKTMLSELREKEREIDVPDRGLVEVGGEDSIKFSRINNKSYAINSIQWRWILYSILESNSSVPSSFKRLPSEEYKIRRILYGITLLPGSSLLLQSNFDYMRGKVDWHKGCYIGQELTFRTYHVGVTRKRIMPVQLVHKDERSSCHNTALALLNLDDVAVANERGEVYKVKAFIPNWWPKVDDRDKLEFCY
ncbi:20922_t:CDS:2, partial [Gigaspora margarita]